MDAAIKDLVDLHLHLGAASTPHFLWELAHRQGVNVGEKDYWRFIKNVRLSAKTDHHSYLSFFDLIERIQSSVFAIEESVYQAISHQYRRADVTTVEIRFNPMLRNRGGEHDLDKIILAATVGMKRAMLDYPVKAGIILMMDRRFIPEINLVIAKKAVYFRKEGIVGVDLAGPIDRRRNFSVDELIKPVELAKKAGLSVTIHTGEITPASEVWQVLTKLSPNRIGHGIHAADDDYLLEELRKKEIVLELCPTSNLHTRVVKNWKEMGKIIRRFLKAGVKININSDGPELLQTDVKKEMQKLIGKSILTISEAKKIVEVARQSTFINS
jgi:adenosine deaminase